MPHKSRAQFNSTLCIHYSHSRCISILPHFPPLTFIIRYFEYKVTIIEGVGKYGMTQSAFKNRQFLDNSIYRLAICVILLVKTKSFSFLGDLKRPCPHVGGESPGIERKTKYKIMTYN